MEIIDTEIRDVKILKPRVFGDERGFFMETWRDSFFRENVADRTFVQDNHSKSTAHVLRGLHYQLNRPQGKLVRVVQGEPGRVRPRLLRHQRDRGVRLQVHQLLRSVIRALHQMERS